METVQLALTDSSYAVALRELLLRNAAWKVLAVDTPDLRLEGVVVLDTAALERLPSQIAGPERVVLIAQNDPRHLAQAWERRPDVGSSRAADGRSHIPPRRGYCPGSSCPPRDR